MTPTIAMWSYLWLLQAITLSQEYHTYEYVLGLWDEGRLLANEDHVSGQ